MMETATKTDDRLAFSIAECAALTSVSEAMLHKEIKAGRLRAKRAGRRVLILKSDFINYLNEGGINEQE
jgi:excisionase family DNA binding protein